MNISTERLDILKAIKQNADKASPEYKGARALWFADVKRDLGLHQNCKLKVGKVTGKVTIVNCPA